MRLAATLATLLCAAAARADFSSQMADGQLTLLRDGAPLLVYHSGRVDAPSGVDPAFGRSGFVHPLFTPSGQVLTRIQAPDHLHHYGIWNPWTQVRFRERVYDLWNIGGKQGTVRFAAFESPPVEAGTAAFTAIHEHVAFDGEGRETVLLRERQTWIARPGPDASSYILDLVIELACATNDPVTLLEHRYGGLGWRATEEWDRDNSSIVSSEGRTRADADSSKARWVLVQGDLDGGRAHGGAALLSWPGNYNHPEPLRVWPPDMHGRGDVFVNFSPTRDRDWRIEPGVPQTLRYRWVVFDGSRSPAEAEGWWTGYTHCEAD
jgi:hypothetical protein